ncbi:MAG TPA: hypothetical protein VLH60_05955 [Sedimentisphaerales bacterium]|nr:hypothetical protein [Sedimentisphaerales bacterium]
MQKVNKNSRTTIHFSVGYLLAGQWAAERPRCLDFQKALMELQMDFSQTTFAGNRFTLIRNDPSNLHIVIESPGPQVAGMTITSAYPQHDIAIFQREAEAAWQAYQKIWPAPQYQVLQCSARMHQLYSCSEHAFKYIWEERLGQKPEDFAVFGGRPVAGGGLRLVMPPASINGSEPASIEVRIESYFREVAKLFVETVFLWPQPRVIKTGERFDPAERLAVVEEYSGKEVWNFLVGGQEQA